MISAYGGSSAPAGYLLCDGAAVSRTTYANLFAAIGTAYGEGDGSTTFNLPDFRGRFLRGVDGTAGRDPNAASRTAMATGGATGNNVGSVQADAFQGFNLSVVYDLNSGTSASGRVLTSSGNTGVGNVPLQNTMIVSDGVNGTPRVASETGRRMPT